jgi:hypothetical protein
MISDTNEIPFIHKVNRLHNQPGTIWKMRLRKQGLPTSEKEFINDINKILLSQARKIITESA